MRRFDETPTQDFETFRTGSGSNSPRQCVGHDGLPGRRIIPPRRSAISLRLRVRSVAMCTRYITASASPQARLHPNAVIIIVFTASLPAVATLSDPINVIAISRPK